MLSAVKSDSFLMLFSTAFVSRIFFLRCELPVVARDFLLTAILEITPSGSGNRRLFRLLQHGTCQYTHSRELHMTPAPPPQPYLVERHLKFQSKNIIGDL